jgi:hypothetical protein
MDIEKIAEEKAKNIAKIIIEKYEDFELEDNNDVINEIYERSIHESTGFLLDNTLDSKTVGMLKSHAEMKLKNSKDSKKMTYKELLSLMIVSYVKDFIWEWKEILIEN